jgi:hypothetical protein
VIASGGIWVLRVAGQRERALSLHFIEHLDRDSADIDSGSPFEQQL